MKQADMAMTGNFFECYIFKEIIKNVVLGMLYCLQVLFFKPRSDAYGGSLAVSFIQKPLQNLHNKTVDIKFFRIAAVYLLQQ